MTETDDIGKGNLGRRRAGGAKGHVRVEIRVKQVNERTASVGQTTLDTQIALFQPDDWVERIIFLVD